MAKNTPKYSFETIDEVLSDIKQSKGLTTSVSKPSLSSSKSVLPENNINSVLSYGGGNPNKALRVAEYNVPMSSVFERLNDGTYTSKFENYLGAEGNENRLALQQSGWEQAGKGLLKNVLKVGSYATDSVIGTAYGLTKALTSGSLRDLYDNELTNKLDDMNKKLDYALPNYYSDEQKSMSTLRQLGTVNFWANDVAGGFAFVGGALLPQIAIGIATGGASLPSLGVTLGKMGAKLGLKAAKEVGEEAAKAALKKGLKSTLDDGLKAMGSTAKKIGNATGYTKGKNVIKSYQTGILGEKLGTFTNTTGFLARTAGFEAGMEARQAMKESVDNYYQKFNQQNGRMPTFEESQTFMNDAVKASNKVFGANMAILTLSNAVMYGKKILPESTSNWINKTIGGKLNNIIGLGTKSAVVDGKLTYTMLGANRAQKLAGKAYKTLSKPLVEGIYEEGLQGVASKTMKNYIDAKYDKNNLDGYSFWGSLNDSFAEQYGTNEGWKEMTIGMIVGFAGGGMTPGAIKNGYAFSGFGKNSYSSRRSEIESNIKRANDGIELLSNLNRTSATVAKEAAMNSGNKSDFIGAEDTLSHYNFIRSQESINSYSQMRNDYNTVIDNLQLEDESLSALESAGLDVDSYKSKLKSDFEKSVNNYQFAKKAVESLGLNNKLKDTPGNIAEVSDALMFGLMAGKDSFENARNIGSQIDSIIGTEGVANHLEFYNNLEQDQKDQFLELRDKQENLKQLQDAAAKVAQKIGKINSTGQMTPELVENRRKRLSEQAVAIQDSIVNTQQRIDEIKDTLSTNFRESKYNLTSEELGKFETVEDVIGAVENIDKIDNLVQSFTKAGKAQEADTLRYLVQQFKISSDSHREMINNYRKMMDTNFFSSKEGKGFLKSILGNKFTMSDDFKKLIQENDAVIDNSLGLNGIRGYEKVQDILESSIVDNDQLSDREKFRLESLIRLSLSKDAYEKAVDDLQSASKNMQVRMSPEGKQLATKPEDLRRINLTAEGLNNIDLLDKAINEITKELDYIINYSTKNIDKIKQLEEELENLRQQREDIIENNKNKQTAPETTATTVSTATTTDTKRQEAESVMSSNLSYNDKISKLVELGLLTTVTLNGNKTNTAVYNGRLIHFMNINGTVIPIYRSSNGTSGKAQGGWYPFFGFGNLYEEATFNDVNNTASGIKNTGKVAGFGDQGWLIKGTGSGEVTYNYEQGHGIEEIQYMQGLFNKNITFSVSTVANKTEFESKGFTTDNTEQIDTSDRSILDFNKSIFGQENLGVYNGDSFTRNQNSKFPLETVGNITSPITSKEWIKSIVDKLNETATATATEDIEAKKADIEKRRQEELNKLDTLKKEIGDAFSGQSSTNDLLRAVGKFFVENFGWKFEGKRQYPLYVSKERNRTEFDVDGLEVNLPEGSTIGIMGGSHYARFTPQEIINAKYDAELAALVETVQQTAPETTATATEDIEAKKADIEKRRQEELSSVTSEINVEENRRPNGSIGTQGFTPENLKSLIEFLNKELSLNIPSSLLESDSLKPLIEYIKSNKELVSKIKNYVKKDPVEVYYLPDGTIQFQDGNHRANLLNLIGSEIIPAIEVGQREIIDTINARYDAELASLGQSVQQNAPFSAPEQTVSAEQEEIQNNITSLEEELNNLNQQRDEINSLIDKQNQVSKFTPEQVEKFKKKWDYYTSVNLTEEENGEYIRWIQSEEGLNWIQKQYPTESMRQDLRNLYQVMPFRKFAYAVRKHMDPFFSEKSAIKDSGRKMSFEEWAGYIIGDGVLEFSKNGYNKLIDSLDDSVLENAGIQRPSVKSETEQATEVKEEEQPKTAEEFVTLLDKQANEDKDKIGFPIKTSEGVFVSSIDGKYRVSYPHKGRITGYAEKKRLTREEAIKLISEKSKLPTSTNKTKQTTEIKEEVSSDSPLKIAEQKINNLKEGESVKAYETTITKNSDGTFTIEKKDQGNRNVDETSAISLLATGIVEDSKGKNISLKDYDIEEVKGEELRVGDIYVRDIGGVRFVYRLLSIPKRDVLKGNFFRSDVEILHIGKHKVSILRNPDGTLYESTADIKVGNKSVDTFKSTDKNYRTFGKVKKINNWTDVSAPNLTTNTINQQLEDYTSRKEEIEKNIVDLENQINDLKSTLDSVKNKVGESFKVDYNNGKLTKGDFGGSRNLGVFDYKGKIVKVVKSKRKISPEQIQSMKDRLGDMDNVYFAEESIDLGDKKAAIVMSKAKGVDASSLTKEDIDNIPQEHWDKLEQDVRELSKRGVQIDLTKRDNLFYDKNKGFEFIDINGISMDESSTDKFFEKDGVEYYYPFEQYRFFPKKFEGGKAMFENIPESNTQSVQSAAQPTSTEEPVQQNALFSAPEQAVSTEQEEIEKKIADLEKQLDDLKRPFKIIESPEYIRYSDLASRAEKENLTEAEKQELEELRTDIDQWTMITGVVVDGFRLSDLLLQKSVLENTVIEKSKDIEIPTSEDTLDDETFADVTTRANYSFGLVYDKVFASKSGDLITLHNINAKSLEDILGKEFMDANGIVLEEDKTGKENVVLSQASIDIINEKSNIRIRKSERNMLTNYSVVLERIVGLDGNITYKPLNSAFSEEFNDGKGHDIQAIYETNPDDTIEITTDLDNVYNIRIINEYKEELNNYNSKPQKSEQDRIELEKAYNKLVSKLNMQAKINGRVVSTMKGLNKTVQDRNSDNIYVALRNNIFGNPEQFNTILTGSGEYSVKITTNTDEFVKPSIRVSQVLMGHPNYNYVETEDGSLATEFRPLSDVEAKAIVDIGYVLGTKTFTRDNQTVNTMFLKKMMNKKSTNKIPFVVLNVGGKRVAYPAKVNSFGEAEVSEFENIYNNKTADPVTKANALNRILAKNGIDIKVPGNSFIGFFDNNVNDSFFQEKLAQLKNVNYFYNVEDWLDLNIDLNDIVKSQISLDIDVLNPFHSPKLSFSYNNLDLKDFVPPKKGPKKGKAKSKSKNVEVNIADLFNKENCI